MNSNGFDLRTTTMGLFGLTVLGSGLWRFFSADGGHAGLWFGIVMGGLAFLSASLFFVRRTGPGILFAAISILLVGGWFGYESFIKKGFANSEIRQLIVIGMTVIAATLMIGSITRSASNPVRTNQPKP